MDDLYANWAKVYDLFYPDRSDEVGFWARLALPSGQRVLDLMCGTAEVSLGLARNGYRVRGVDRSPPMLGIGAQRLAAAADYPARSLSLILGDACAIPSSCAAFDFALVGGNGSFNHLNDEQAPLALDELYRVLRPGGWMGLELVNPHLLKEIYPERTFGPFRPTHPGVAVSKVSSNRYDRESQLFHIRQVTRYEIDGERGTFEVSFALRVRSAEEMQQMLATAGFHDVTYFGGYDLEPFDQWSSDLLVIATKPLQPPRWRLGGPDSSRVGFQPRRCMKDGC
jgi:ubiquinone/menaquinone biosynthesis C-methylase UbiE